ncbi:MAG: DNA polymerase [Akkermansiaceae bacterium]
MMIEFEELLTRLRDEYITLEDADQSVDPEVIHGLKGKKNQEHIRKFQTITKYLAPYRIEMIDTLEVAEATAGQLRNRPLLGIDIETGKTEDHPQAGLNPKISTIRLVQLFDGETIYVFDCHRIGSVTWMEMLKNSVLIAHNMAFEAQHFHHAGIDFSNPECTMLMGRILSNRSKSLADAAKEFCLDVEMDKALQVSDWNRKRLLPEQIQYAALDAVVAYELRIAYMQMIRKDACTTTTYDFLMDLLYPLVRQQAHGINVDVDAHDVLIKEWTRKVEALESALYDDGLHDPKSVKQKQAYLEGKLTDDESDAWRKTKNGNLSADNASLTGITNHPSLGMLAEYTTLSARLANFGPKLQDLLVNGELYPSYMIAGMVSGRYGCRAPNIQNNPRSGFKHIYRAPKGCKFVTGDLAQVELRVAGLLSEDPVINAAYEQGQDLHRLMASKMTGKPENVITKEDRTAAKGANFGLLFGGGARGLQQYVRASYGVNMTMEQAVKAKSAFHNTYKDFTFWQKAIVKHTNKYDESETEYSRLTRHYSMADHYRDGQYHDIYTHAMNHPIQGTAWEILALAIIYIDARMGDGIRISHHVYDELCMVAVDERVDEAARLLRSGFECAYQKVFPGCNIKGIIEVGAGDTWSEASSEDAIINLDGDAA